MSLARALLVVGLVTATLPLEAHGGPPERSVSRFHGLEGYATFSMSDGCTSGYVNVYAVEEMTQEGPGGPVSTAYAAVFYNANDWCTGQYVNGSGWDTGAVIRGSAVQSLTTRATVPMTVCSSPSWSDPPTCSSRTLLLELGWTANGGTASHGQSTEHTSSPSWTLHSHSVGLMTTADVSGTLLMDGADLLANVAWSAGGLSRVQEGSIEFTRY